jgi:CheR methyltransferase-like protein
MARLGANLLVLAAEPRPREGVLRLDGAAADRVAGRNGPEAAWPPDFAGMLADPTTVWAALPEPRRRQAPLTDLRTLGRFDNVFCRNVLIDFDQPTRARVPNAIAGLLPADGLLYLGAAAPALRITSRRVPLPGERGVDGLATAAAAVA